MDIVLEYFNFRQRYLYEYCDFLMPSEIPQEVKEEYLNLFLKTYINAYFLEIFETIDKKKRTHVSFRDITSELQGKYHEALYQLSNYSKKSEEEVNKLKPDILKCYQFALFAVLLDIVDYSECEIITDFEIAIKKVLERNTKLVEVKGDNFDKLVRMIRKNTKTTDDYLKKLTYDNFFINYNKYRGQEGKYIAKLDFEINQITNTYKKIVVDKIFNSKDIYEGKLRIKINMVNTMILEKLLKRENLDYYFLELPIEYIDNKEKFEDILSICSNPIFKEYVIFNVNYKYYTNSKSLFKGLEDYKYALVVDLMHTKDINAKLEELESLTMFNYIIVDGVKDEDRRLVTEAEMPGKEIFQNRYEFESEGE